MTKLWKVRFAVINITLLINPKIATAEVMTNGGDDNSDNDNSIFWLVINICYQQLLTCQSSTRILRLYYQKHFRSRNIFTFLLMHLMCGAIVGEALSGPSGSASASSTSTEFHRATSHNQFRLL
jgi:hypothetical protein